VSKLRRLENIWRDTELDNAINGGHRLLKKDKWNVIVSFHMSPYFTSSLMFYGRKNKMLGWKRR
jgi:hypothetical protein